jgi:hypothetical protein
MAVVLPAGTSATIKDEPSGSPTALDNLKTIGGNDGTMAFADVTALADSTLKKLPSRLDPGTVQLTFYLDDTAPATNQINGLKTKRDAKTKVTIAVNLPGAFDDSTKIITYTGYIATVSNPEIGSTDDALQYSVTLQVSAA